MHPNIGKACVAKVRHKFILRVNREAVNYAEPFFVIRVKTVGFVRHEENPARSQDAVNLTEALHGSRPKVDRLERSY